MNVTLGCSKLCVALSLGAVMCFGSPVHQHLIADEGGVASPANTIASASATASATVSATVSATASATSTTSATIAVPRGIALPVRPGEPRAEDEPTAVNEQDGTGALVPKNATSPVSVRDLEVTGSETPLPKSTPEEMSEVWEISTRHLPDRFRCINTDNPGFDVHRFECGRGWVRDSLDEALADDGRLPILYVHGNFMERNNSLNRVLIINNYLKPRASRPYRLIMFSWPSQRESKPLHDVFENAESAECQALYVAWLLEKLGRHSQVSVLGFSFGARSVTGALHLASGGSIPGFAHRSVAPDEAVQSVYRVGLVAPALDRTWLMTNGKHRMALDRVDAMVNLYNSKDPILRRFRFLDGGARPVAAGFAGFVGLSGSSDPRVTVPLAGQSKIRQYDCGSVIGTTHSEKSYYGECPYFGTVLDTLLWNESIGSCISQ